MCLLNLTMVKLVGNYLRLGSSEADLDMKIDVKTIKNVFIRQNRKGEKDREEEKSEAKV